jgi:hypothetical protein
MPEASVNKDHSTTLWKYQVRAPWDLLAMQPEAEAARMESPTKNQFRLCVFTVDSGHHSRTGLLVYDVSHLVPGLCA